MRYLTDQQALHLTGNGVADLAGNRMDVVIAQPAASPITGSVEELVIGPVGYFKMPPAARSQTEGKAWVSIDPLSGSGGGSLGQDPNAYLKAISNAVVNIRNVGQESIRQVPTTHFHGELDLKRTASPAAISMGQAMGLSSYPLDYYLDRQGRLRRIAMRIQPAPGSAATSTLTSESVTMDFHDFGSADTSALAVPPANQTVDISQIPRFAVSPTLDRDIPAPRPLEG